MITIPRDDWKKRATPGTWHPTPRLDGTKTAMIACPLCKKIAGLHEHQIEADGTVSPSVVCPTKGCTFHEMVKLDGWPA